MFTSRAEYRTLLRQDNADLRLTAISHELGLASDERLRLVQNKEKQTTSFVKYLRETSASPEQINPVFESKESAPINQSDKIFKFLSRPNLTLNDFVGIQQVDDYLTENEVTVEVAEQTEIQIKYAGYIEKELQQVHKIKRLEDILIPTDFDFDRVKSLSFESREKFKKIRPETLSQASRISGVSPSDISVLLVYMGR
jgi:tRNA uridine 5-carboxymethylaminomethyl modification enzyme